MLTKSERDFLNVLRICVNEKADPKELATFDLDSILDLCKKGALTSLVDYGLEKNGILHEEYKAYRDSVIVNQLRLDAEVNALTQFFEEKHIPYIKLKGMVVRDLYPAFATREMGDADILIERKHREVAIEHIKQMGFEDDGGFATYHDGFFKGSCMIEIHYSLVSGEVTKAWRSFKDEVFQRAIKDENKEYEYHLSIEDHYIYLLLHAFKHYATKGIGVRALLDFWIYKNKYPNETSSDYVTNTLKALAIDQYAKNALELADILFDQGIDQVKLTPKQEKDLEYYVGSGSVQGALKDGQIIKDLSKVKGKGFLYIYFYALKELEEDDTWYAFNAPFAYQHKWFRPIALLKISIQKLLNNPKGVSSHYKD